MIVIDTHIWIWWVNGSPNLKPSQLHQLIANQSQGIGISVISCWEVAMLVEKGRITLTFAVADWVNQALQYPGVRLLPLTPRIAVESTQLPGTFHQDPADRIIVATARTHNCKLLTVDSKILAYPYVQAIST